MTGSYVEKPSYAGHTPECRVNATWSGDRDCDCGGISVRWIFDRETGEHFLPIDDDRSWKAYRTAAGDYALTIHSDSAGHGGEVEFFDSLRQAKQHAEQSEAPL